MSRYSIDLDALTVIRTDEHGESFDLNAGGERCMDKAALRAFIEELHVQGAYATDVRDALLAEVAKAQPAHLVLSHEAECARGRVYDEHAELFNGGLPGPCMTGKSPRCEAKAWEEIVKAVLDDATTLARELDAIVKLAKEGK